MYMTAASSLAGDFNGVNSGCREYPTLRISSRDPGRQHPKSAFDGSAAHDQRVALTRSSQWVGLLYVMWSQVIGVVSHSTYQSCCPFLLMPMISASIRRMPDPQFVQPLKSALVSQAECKGVTITVVPNLPDHGGPGAMVYNQPGSNRPSKSRGCKETPPQIGIGRVA